jgi:hypothetical protein
MTQPLMQNKQGCILTVGFVLGGERMACVLPIATSAEDMTLSGICLDACNSFITSVLGDLLACVSSDAYCSHVQAEGMQNGAVPYRNDFSSTAQVGTGAAGACPANSATLITFYEEPADVISPFKIRTGKTFIPGIPKTAYVNGALTDAQLISAYGFGTDCIDGWPSANEPSYSWYRVLSVPKPRSTVQNCKRISVATPRGYAGTQRRRLLPRL